MSIKIFKHLNFNQFNDLAIQNDESFLNYWRDKLKVVFLVHVYYNEVANSNFNIKTKEADYHE